MGYQHTLKLEPDVGNRAKDALREFGDWARGTFLDDISSTFGADLPFTDELDLDSLRGELLEEYPHGCDWTGISNAMLIHSPNQVVYVSIDNPNHTSSPETSFRGRLGRRPTNGATRPAADVFQIPMDLGFVDSSRHAAPVLWWEDISWPQFVGPEAMSNPSSRSWTAGTPFKCGPASRRPSTVPAGRSTREWGTGRIASLQEADTPANSGETSS